MVPSTSTTPPNQIHFTSGFKYAWITGLPVSGLRPAYTTYKSQIGDVCTATIVSVTWLARKNRRSGYSIISDLPLRNTSSVARSDSKLLFAIRSKFWHSTVYGPILIDCPAPISICTSRLKAEPATPIKISTIAKCTM